MIKSVQKAMTLLSILSDSYDKPVTLAELSYQAGINKSTCSHIISTLESEGYAIKISHSKGYMLGPTAYCLSRFGRYKNEFVSVCRPIMQYLHRNLGYSIVLAVIEGGEKYLIDYIDDGVFFENKERIRRDDIYRTATGRAILSNLSPDGLKEITDKYGFPTAEEWPEIQNSNSISDYLIKMQNSDVFKSQATLSGENLNLGYGCAIFNNIGCVGAIGVAVQIPCDKESLFLEEEKKITALLVRGAHEITHRLSGL